MILYEYECWKCSEWHKGKAQDEEELNAIAQDIGVLVRVIEGEVTCMECGRKARNEDAILHDNGETFCYECA